MVVSRSFTSHRKLEKPNSLLDEIALGSLWTLPPSPNRHGPRTRNIETTKELEDSLILDAVRDGLNEEFPRV